MDPEQRAQRITELLPDTLEYMADNMEREGWSFLSAMHGVVDQYDHELARILRQVLLEVSLGMTIPDALRRMADREPVPELTAVAEALIHEWQTTRNMKDILWDEAERIRTWLDG